MKTILVTGAGGPLGVNATRSLRAAGGADGEAGSSLRIVGTDANRWHLPLSVCDQTYLIPLARDRDGYRRALLEIAAREAVSAILPTHPVEVRAVAELRDAGELGAMATALPATAVIELADDKARTQACLAAAGIAVPDTLALNTPSDVDEAFARWGNGQPVWVRGSGAPGLGIGGAALPCLDAGVARAWIEHHRGWGKMAASVYLPGANVSWMGLFADGVLIAAGARERLEYVLPHVSPSGITGAPAVSRTIDREDVCATGEASVRAIDPAPHGVYFVDLKEDSEGVARVTEINAGRCGTTVMAYTSAGFNFPAALVDVALGQPMVPIPNPHRAVRAGRYWIRTLDCGPVDVDEDAFDRYPRAGFPS